MSTKSGIEDWLTVFHSPHQAVTHKKECHCLWISLWAVARGSYFPEITFRTAETHLSSQRLLYERIISGGNVGYLEITFVTG